MAKFKVVITARSFGEADEKAYECLKEAGCSFIKLKEADGSITEQLKREIVDADAVIAGLEDIGADVIGLAKNLKVISRYGVGYDKVDINAAKEKGIQVTITPGANGDSVADLAVALMLDVARNVTVMDCSVKGRDQKRPQGLEMYEKTLGVIGAGRIGQGVAMRCRGFSMRILACDVYEDEAFKEKTGAEYVDLNTLLKESDFITIHSPLTKETRNLISEPQFKLMKRDAIIVNTARGGVVDEAALYEALKANEIRGAGLDATIEEPPYNSPLMNCENCILIPHAGAATKEASSKMSLMAAQNAIEVLKGNECRYNVVK